MEEGVICNIPLLIQLPVFKCTIDRFKNRFTDLSLAPTNKFVTNLLFYA